MADLNNADVSFVADAAKIFAKLHRGGCQKYIDCMYFNSGVKDDKEGLAPEDVDGSKITFDTTLEAYELGVVGPNPIEFKIKHTADEIAKVINGEDEEDDEEDEDEEDEEGKDKKENEGKDKEGKDGEGEGKGEGSTPVSEDDIPSFSRFLFEEGEAAPGGEGGSTSDAGKSADTGKSADAGKSADTGKSADAGKPADAGKSLPVDKSGNIIDPFVMPKNVPGDKKSEVQDMVEENVEIMKKALDKYVENSVTWLQEYMETFAGEEESKKIKRDNVEVVYLPDQSSPETFAYKSGSIAGISDSQMRSDWIKTLKSSPGMQKRRISNVCVKIPYSLTMKED